MGEEFEFVVEFLLGLVFDWEPELLELVEHAAEQQGLSCEEFILEVVEREARRLLAPEKPLVTLDEAASIFDLPRTEVIRRITAGKLRARKLGEEWMVELDEAPEKKENPLRQIRRELEQLVKTAGLTGLQTEGEVPDSISTTWCFVNQEQILVCPVAAWRKYGHDRVITEAKDALRRFRRRQDRELGHF